MMTLVISLRESKARRQKIAELLQAAGLSYRIVDAILGSSLPESRTVMAPVRFMARFGRDLGPEVTQACLGSVPFVRRQHRLNSGGRCGCSLQPVRSDWCPRNDGVLSRLRYIANAWVPLCSQVRCSRSDFPTTITFWSSGCRTGGAYSRSAELEACGDGYYLRDVNRHRATTYEVVPTLVEQSDLAGSRNRASRRHPTVPTPARPLISCLEVAPRSLSAWSFTQRAWGESRARTVQA